jgi:pimeloyl-ACP methyl ester carboxylesterase
MMTDFGGAEEFEHLSEAAATAGLAVKVVLPAHLRVIAHGISLHCLDWGTEGRTPVLFLHGGGLTARTYDLLCLVMRAEFHCYALDQRGHGDSSWAPDSDYSIDAHVSDVADVIAELGLLRPVLVGMSMGGSNAIAFAQQYPDTLSALVVIDTGPDIHRQGADAIVAFMKGPSTMDSLDDFIERAKAFNPRRDKRLLRRSLRHNLKQLADGRWTWKYDPRTVPDLDQVIESHRKLRERIGTIQCPTLILRGAESAVLSREDAAAFAQALPDGRWQEIPGAGHTVQGDNPGAAALAILEFIRPLET